MLQTKQSKIYRIHINQNEIKLNNKIGDRKPVITIKVYEAGRKRSSENIYANEVTIVGSCKVVYNHDAPLNCGAKVWIEVDDSESELVIK